MNKVRSEDAPTWGGRQDEDALVAAACEILERRMSREGADLLQSPTEAGTYAKLKLRSLEREVFAVLFMDTRHRMIAFEELFFGTVGGTEVHPREVVKRALHHNSAAVICAHNHPSGNGEPSAADRAVTARLKQALALVDIRLLDHFVIGEGPPVSLAARGWV